MKVTIVYDNETLRGDLQANWGFAALVESNGRRILFDTGASGALLLSNMKTLGIAPERIDDVFISHFHFDHTGGLSAFLDRHGDVTVWIPPSFRGVKNARRVVEVGTPRTLYEGIHSTGELEGIEQSLCVQTKKGIVVIAGCRVTERPEVYLPDALHPVPTRNQVPLPRAVHPRRSREGH
jgi:7,8-dihydropterin-6-yl-methyl-4-(beta-D-ribofuranosyl)aminobenzene 5'-phosphate synthase